MNKELLLLISALTLTFISGVLITLVYEDLNGYVLSKISKTKVNSCDSGELFKDSYCLRNQLNEWYNYNLTNKRMQYNLDILKTEGGVCWHYSQWYKNELLSRGYYAEEATITINKTMTHRFAIASNSDGYCILDQTEVTCTPI